MLPIKHSILGQVCRGFHRAGAQRCFYCAGTDGDHGLTDQIQFLPQSLGIAIQRGFGNIVKAVKGHRIKGRHLTGNDDNASLFPQKRMEHPVYQHGAAEIDIDHLLHLLIIAFYQRGHDVLAGNIDNGIQVRALLLQLLRHLMQRCFIRNIGGKRK